MATKTDPAREIADFCKRLATGSSVAGDRHLADAFGVQAWSRDFLEILSSFMERTEFLIQIINELDLDDDQSADLTKDVRTLQRLCSREVLSSNWNAGGHAGLSLVKSTHVAAIGTLSGQVRQRVQYPKLDDEEIDEVLALVDELLCWLEEHQLRDHDFIRHALIQGLKQFRFRLGRLGWLGWNCTLDALHDVVAAYMALERGFPQPGDDTNAGAMAKKTIQFLKQVWDKTGLAAEAKSRADVAIQFYGWYAVARDTGVVGLLTSSN